MISAGFVLSDILVLFNICSMSDIIHLRDALRLMDESMTPDGKVIPFSVSFVKFSQGKPIANGELVSYRNCVKTVVRQNMKKFMQRGIRLLDSNEIRTVHIYLITEFNGKVVRW
jgi:hypothetical protein